MTHSSSTRSTEAQQYRAAGAAPAARRWLVALLVAWPVTVLGSGGMWWKPIGWLAVAWSLWSLAWCALPLRRMGRQAFAWCGAVSLGGAAWELGVLRHELDPSSTVIGIVPALVVSTLGILAFSTAMGDLARVARSRRSMQQWRSVLRWQLGVMVAAIVVLVGSSEGGLATLTCNVGSFSGNPWVVPLLLGALIAFALYPFVAMLRLRRALRQCFDPS